MGGDSGENQSVEIGEEVARRDARWSCALNRIGGRFDGKIEVIAILSATPG